MKGFGSTMSFDDVKREQAKQHYPDDNPKTVYGVAKPPMHVIPPTALIHLGQAMANGKQKYGAMNWRDKKVTSSIYYDAAMRHLMAWWDGENNAEDSGVHHLGHAMACLAILLDAKSVGMLNDDRPTKGAFSAEVGLHTVNYAVSSRPEDRRPE